MLPGFLVRFHRTEKQLQKTAAIPALLPAVGFNTFLSDCLLKVIKGISTITSVLNGEAQSGLLVRKQNGSDLVPDYPTLSDLLLFI